MSGEIRRLRYIHLCSIVVICVLLTGCIPGMVETVTVYKVLDELDPHVREWVDSLNNQEGIHLARVPISKQVEEYYLYCIPMPSGIVIRTEGRDGIRISTEGRSLQGSKVLIITTINRRAKFFMVGEDKITADSMKLICTKKQSSDE